jgi:hypothetical protein
MRRALLSAALLLVLLPVSASARPLSVDDVARLSDRGVGDDVIVAQIASTRSRFDLSADDILFLKDHGVSDRVIEAMIAAAGEEVGEGERGDDDARGVYRGSLYVSLGYNDPWRWYDAYSIGFVYPWRYFYDYPSFYYAYCHPSYYCDYPYWWRNYYGGYCSTRTYVRSPVYRGVYRTADATRRMFGARSAHSYRAQSRATGEGRRSVSTVKYRTRGGASEVTRSRGSDGYRAPSSRGRGSRAAIGASSTRSATPAPPKFEARSSRSESAGGRTTIGAPSRSSRGGSPPAHAPSSSGGKASRGSSGSGGRMTRGR